MMDRMCWSKGHAGGSQCPTIKNHSVTYFSNHLYCFGGYDGARNQPSLLIYSLAEERWVHPMQLAHSGPYLGAGDHRYVVEGTPPPARNGHSATLAIESGVASSCQEGKIIIIGGWLGTGPLAASDVHVLTVRQDGFHLTWEQPETKGTPPGPCNMHSADYVSSRKSVYVFRGGNGREYLNDLHALNVDTMEWDRIETTGEIPQLRANHSSAIVESTQELFVFGGWNGKSRLNDIHILDTKTNTWTFPHVNGVLPHPRAGMTLTAIRNRLYLFGGSGASAKSFDDLQILDRDTMSWLDVTAAHSAISNENGATEQSWQTCSPSFSHSANSGAEDGFPSAFRANASRAMANPNDEDGVPVVWLQGKGPGRRAGHAATAVHRQIFVFGGSCGSDYLNDCYTLDTDPPPSLAVTSSPTLDLVTQRLQHFCNDPEFSDVTFLVEGRQVYGHKMVLSIVSECFRAMFGGGFRETEDTEITIPDCSYWAFVAILEYIYSGTLPHRLLQQTNGRVSPNVSLEDASSLASEGTSGGIAIAVSEAAVELLELADRFFLDHLKETCECRLQRAVNSETVEYLLGVAHKANAVQLGRVCEHFLRNQEEGVP